MALRVGLVSADAWGCECVLGLKTQVSGEFLSGFEDDSLCVAIKRQPGELYGTTDLVFLPTLSVKNALPCDMLIKRKKRFSNQAQLL